VQDTGWAQHLPSDEGLVVFSTPDEAADAIARVDGDYARHAAKAADIAEEYFGASRVLSSLLARAA
jgi:hypothetical protein